MKKSKIGNNKYVARAIDIASITIITLIASFVWSVLLFADWKVALIFACDVSVCVLLLINALTKHKRTPYGEDRLALEFALKGNEFVIKTILSAIKNDKIENGCNYILLENSAIIANYKFSSLSPSDIQSVCALANKLQRTHVFVITKAIDRKAYQVASAFEIKIDVVKTKEIFKFLKKHNALPALNKVKAKPSIRVLTEIILSRQNFKHYAFSGVVLMLVSLITPFKTYYLVIGSILIVLAILCLTPIGKGTLSSPKALDILEKESQEEYKRE